MPNFQRELERPDATERFARVYAPIMLAASVVLAIVVSLVRQDMSNFFWALSAMLTIACPLPILCAFGRAYYNVARRLLSEGAALAGGQAAFRVRKARRAVIQDSDLFPGGTITINEVRAHSGYTPEKAAVLRGGDHGRLWNGDQQAAGRGPARAVWPPGPRDQH